MKQILMLHTLPGIQEFPLYQKDTNNLN
ncbi:hypothetical protein NC653_024803 [Populus alba x Populus x berolinensis]|uniref:Uncharacterized protein n=1 Tax=Populus alba x Populus x berolinensis TaxID=444605 RepID=A0AAD6Q8A0_9ROSI|nr:hypothetical protein NC653_024801 [Populus alba x Populus x berolinensis]KAJ6981517.1 hypothetical protein NC653_024803 [Populus alba x Populus x berolinensis]